MRIAVALALPLLLAACVGDPKPATTIITHNLPTPVPTPCAPALGPTPDFPDTDAKLRAIDPYPNPVTREQKLANLFAEVKAIAAGRPMHFAWEAKQSAALAACKGSGGQ